MITLRKLFFLVLALVLLSLTGCASYLNPGPNSVARPEARVELVNGGGSDLLFQTNDLTLVYSYSQLAENFTLSGKLAIADGVTNSFNLVKRFRLKMSFLDRDGRVLESVDISPFYGHLKEVPRSAMINVSHPRPAGAEAIVFHYFGVFRGGGEEIGGDEWFISYSPF